MKIKNGVLSNVNHEDIVNGEFIIPDSVTIIKRYAFGFCYNLVSIIIPNSVIEIGDRAFTYCDNLKSITIPDSITKIAAETFDGCYKLKSINIPNSVTEIGMRAFYNCNNLESITIPNSVIKIGNYAFFNCYNLESINIPNSVIKIGNSSFNQCKNLKSINVNKGNKYYSSENAVLFNKDKAALIKYPQGKKDKKYVIPDSVIEIGYYAFANCTNLESITIPDSVTKIGVEAFSSCFNLKSIKIPNSITEIRKGAFDNCKALESKKGNYKAFEKGLICNNMHYIPNEWNTIDGDIKICKWGLHYVANLFDIFTYYAGNLEKDIEIWEVETGNIIANSKYDSKKATSIN